MADLASSDVTVTIQKTRILRGSPGGIRFNTVLIAFGNATLTYPSGGVPMPTYPSFGMMKEIEFLQIMTPGADGVVWTWDYSNKKLRGWLQGTNISAAGAGTIDDYPLDGTADPYVAAARQPSNGAIVLGLGNTAAAGVIYLGRLQEMLAAEHAPAAQSIYGIAIGW